MSQFLGLDRQRISIVPLGIDITRLQISLSLSPSLPLSDCFRPPANSRLPRPPRAGKGPPPSRRCFHPPPQHARHAKRPAPRSPAGWAKNTAPTCREIFDRLRASRPRRASSNTSARSIAAASSIFFPRSTCSPFPRLTTSQKASSSSKPWPLACPSSQPDHGAFPEVLAETQGGLLHRPEDSQTPRRALHELLSDAPLRHRLATSGRQHVHTSRNSKEMALRTAAVLQSIILRRPGR